MRVYRHTQPLMGSRKKLVYVCIKSPAKVCLTALPEKSPFGSALKQTKVKKLKKPPEPFFVIPIIIVVWTLGKSLRM